MLHEYDLQTDVLATIIAKTPVSKKHADLLAALATRTDHRGARYVMTRDIFSGQPARVIDSDGREIAPDYHTWINAQLLQHGGSVRAVLEAHKNCGYLLTENQPLLHYFVHDRGGDQDNFVQIAVWEEQEFVERAVFQDDIYWGIPDADELRRGSTSAPVKRIERRTLGTPRYKLAQAIDMHRFAAVAETAYGEFHRAAGDRQMVETNSRTGERRVVTLRELTPGYDQIVWKGRRFFDDWEMSSAGRAGERACTWWTFSISDDTDTKGRRHLSFVPQWAHTRKIAKLTNTHKLDAYSLYGKLNQFDKRIGMQFAWYFYGLHGNLIVDSQMERVLAAAEDGLIVLPEHDYQVLRRWGNQPYGF